MEKLGAGNKKIKQILSWQRSAKDRREAGVFIVEGTKMYKEAPSDWIKEVYLTQKVLDELGEPQHTCYLVEDSVFEKMSDTQTPQGVLTVLKRPEYSVKDIINDAQNGSPLILLLENLQDPGNLGTILRVGEAAGVTGIIMTKGTVDIFNPKVVRSTMGSIYRMPFAYTENICETIKELKNAGVTTYAAHLHGSEVYTEYDYSKPTAFMIGNEGNGLTDAATEMADKRLLIPMEGSVESLNAGIATAVLIYEAHRQRA